MSQVPSLLRTSKFEVWNANSMASNNNFTRPHSVDETIILSLKSLRKIAPSEVLQVAVDNYFIELEGVEEADIASSNNVSKDLLYDVSKFNNSITNNNISSVNDYYPIEICRATLFTRLVSLLHIASKLRVKVFLALVDMLNSGVVPALSVCGDVGGDTLGAVLGLPGYYCYTIKGLQPAKTALTGLTSTRSLVLTTSEASFFESDACLYTGVGSIIISAITNLTNTIDCVAAVSCEAVGSSAESFDPLLWETNRHHRGQMNSASNLKILLEGSRRSSSQLQQNKMIPTEAALVFHQLPQSTGPARDYILAASK